MKYLMKRYSLYTILVIFGSALFQFLLITYKHLIGYVIIRSPAHFFVMLLTGTVLTAIMTGIIIIIDVRII